MPDLYLSDILRLRDRGDGKAILLEWYNSATGVWEEKLRLDNDTGNIELVGLINVANVIPETALRDIKWGTVSIDPPSIAAGASANVDVTVSGLAVGDRILVMCQEDLEAGLVPQAAYVPAADTHRVRLYNPTGAAIDGVARTWLWVAFK